MKRRVRRRKKMCRCRWSVENKQQWQNKSQIHQELKLVRILFTDRLREKSFFIWFYRPNVVFFPSATDYSVLVYVTCRYRSTNAVLHIDGYSISQFIWCTTVPQFSTMCVNAWTVKANGRRKKKKTHNWIVARTHKQRVHKNERGTMKIAAIEYAGVAAVRVFLCLPIIFCKKWAITRE